MILLLLRLSGCQLSNLLSDLVVPNPEARLVLSSFDGEFFLTLIQINRFILRVMDQFLVEDDESVSLEPLVPETPS